MLIVFEFVNSNNHKGSHYYSAAKAVATVLSQDGFDTDEAINQYCVETGINFADLESASKKQPLVTYRFGLYFLLRQLGHSYPEIGSLVGKRDHTTALSGIREFQEHTRDLGLLMEIDFPSTRTGNNGLEEHLEVEQILYHHPLEAVRKVLEQPDLPPEKAWARYLGLINISREELQNQNLPLGPYRQGAAYLLYQLKFPFPKIARRLGVASYSTLVQRINKFRRCLKKFTPTRNTSS